VDRAIRARLLWVRCAAAASGATTLSSVRIAVTDEYLEIRLAPWQKALGLMRDIRVARADISDVHVVADPVREAMRGGVKVGLRVPWIYFAARTIGLDQAFIVRRGVPGLSVAFENDKRLRRVLVSTPEADKLARRLIDDS
jgi:hypothetical protein